MAEPLRAPDPSRPPRPDADAPPVLTLADVTFGYRREPVLEHVDLVVRARDYLAVLGPNGGGKTTLLKLMLGLLEPWSGTVTVHLERGRSALGYVPQVAAGDRRFPIDLRSLVRMGRLGRRGLFTGAGAADEGEVERALALLGLEELAAVQVRELSGGQLQRGLIARALVCEPEVLLLDEPFAALDSESRRRLRGALRELNRRVAVVVVTHDLSPVADDVAQAAWVERTVHCHEGLALTRESVERLSGCPIDVLDSEHP
ncbi:MAG TPA: ATP-binding cassette domain-containing protein [Thermoanaerobaculia bacterium]|nr:ATP-binding cassette domain-containing protein [Thermoanaerobaculia bacterium]